MIPENVTVGHVLQALAEIDRRSCTEQAPVAGL